MMQVTPCYTYGTRHSMILVLYEIYRLSKVGNFQVYYYFVFRFKEPLRKSFTLSTSEQCL